MKYLTLFATLVASQVQSCDPYIIEDNTTRTHIYENKARLSKREPDYRFLSSTSTNGVGVITNPTTIQDVEGEKHGESHPNRNGQSARGNPISKGVI